MKDTKTYWEGYRAGAEWIRRLRDEARRHPILFAIGPSSTGAKPYRSGDAAYNEGVAAGIKDGKG